MAIAWRQESPASMPGLRVGHGMCYDHIRDEVVMFGGRDPTGGPTSSSYWTDTWVWNYHTRQWTQKFPTHTPPYRSSGFLAWDDVSGKVLLFGGDTTTFNNTSERSDTWHWDGTDWTQLSPSTVPDARTNYMMCAVPSSLGNVFMYGGIKTVSGSLVYLSNMFKWTGTNWVSLSPATSPGTRHDAGMTYDPDNGHIVLYGGASNGTVYTDTWFYQSDLNWHSQSPANHPNYSVLLNMVHIDFASRVITYDGSLATGEHRYMWLWDNTNWTDYVLAGQPEHYAIYYQELIAHPGGAVLFAYDNSQIQRTWTIFDDAAAPSSLGTLAYYKDGAWHLVRDLALAVGTLGYFKDGSWHLTEDLV